MFLARWLRALRPRRESTAQPEPSDYHTIHANSAASYCDPRGKCVLVVGCNTGGDCQQMIRLGAAEVRGIDVVDEIGQDYQHERVRYQRMSAERMDFRGEQFDLVYAVATIEHVHRIDLAFPEMARVTRRGGIVYSVASPLWNSQHGHHKADLFPNFPWIHLRKTRDEIIAYAQGQGVNPPGGLALHVDYMLDDRFFNKLPARHYVEVCRNLRNVAPIENRLDRDPEESVSREILAELAPKGYNRDELTAVTHYFVGRKLS